MAQPYVLAARRGRSRGVEPGSRRSNAEARSLPPQLLKNLKEDAVKVTASSRGQSSRRYDPPKEPILVIAAGHRSGVPSPKRRRRRRIQVRCPVS